MDEDLPALLRAIASGTDAKMRRHEMILNAAAAEIERLRREVGHLYRQMMIELYSRNSPRTKEVVERQANDEGLWFRAETITEDILQRALRELHAAIEGTEPPNASPQHERHHPD